jgi:hypothetical protein
MFPHMHQYMKAKYGNLPTVELTRDEMVEMFTKHGKTREEAEFQVNTVMVGLGASDVVIGDTRYKLKEIAPDGAQDHTS